jgi:hypothetical protein
MVRPLESRRASTLDVGGLDLDVTRAHRSGHDVVLGQKRSSATTTYVYVVRLSLGLGLGDRASARQHIDTLSS